MTTVTHRPRNVKALRAAPPVHGTCRWALQPTAAAPGCLVIGDTAYLVYAVTQLRGPGQVELTGYRLGKADGTAYNLPADLSNCDCPDATFRGRPQGGCKHRKALLQALLALKKGGA